MSSLLTKLLFLISVSFPDLPGKSNEKFLMHNIFSQLAARWSNPTCLEVLNFAPLKGWNTEIPEVNKVNIKRCSLFQILS